MSERASLNANVLGMVAILLVAAQSAAHPNQPLVDGVRKIATTGIPGPLAIYGQQAFPVVTGRLNKQPAAVVAATSWRKGRFVVFGHTGYFSKDTLEKEDTGTLMVNAVQWASGRKSASIDKVRVAVVGAAEFAAWLRGRGFQVLEASSRDLPAAAAQADVVAVPSHGLNDPAIGHLRNYVASGKGVVTNGLAWGWQQGNVGKSISADHPGNRLLAGAGIAFADGYLETTEANAFTVTAAPPPLLNASVAWQALLAQRDQKQPMSKADVQLATHAAGMAVRFAEPSQNPILKAVLDYGSRVRDAGMVSPQKPIKLEHGVERVLLTARLVEAERLPPERVKPDPNAMNFPGAVPGNAKRVRRTLTLATDLPGWQSTGLYAAPGQMIEVAIPAAATPAKLSLRIGCHTDQLWHLDSWRRCPSISNVWSLEQPRTRCNSPFGGLIYLVVPADCALPSVEITIQNAVEAPWYVLGKTSATEWKSRLRNLPAPWAELQAGQVILSVPSQAVRELDDPEPLLKFWDEVIAACAELGPRPLRHFRPERYVPDEQISAGYMHSGYPIMTHLDAVETLVNVNKLRAGEGASWGLYHEMGHNHQHSEWTFDGTGEVTVNLFTLYVFDKLCKRPQDGHSALKFGAARQQMIRKYLGTGPDFRVWKEDPFLALHMYMQLQEAFGWETFQAVFTEYRGLDRQARPRNDDQKRDQWLVRFSKACGKNLGPFFDAWGVPVTEAAKREVAHLPHWMPDEWPTSK